MFFFKTVFVFGIPLNSEIQKALNLIYNTKEFQSSFLQEENGEISEGSLYLKDKRIKIQYEKPTKIQIIISEKKAMYYNEDLEEVEYFNPKNSTASIFYDIFYNQVFFLNAKTVKEKNFIKIEKKIDTKDGELNIEIFFENNPLIIKRISVKGLGQNINFNILNPNFNPNLNKKFFSMIHPLPKQ